MHFSVSHFLGKESEKLNKKKNPIIFKAIKVKEMASCTDTVNKRHSKDAAKCQYKVG